MGGGRRGGGLRIDHPDGLTDPAGYLARLAAQAHAAAAAGRPETWIVVEKILEPGEELPDWPVAGTTGYDALAEADGVLVDPAGEEAFSELDERLTGVRTSWPDLVHQCKLEVATGMLRAEVLRLTLLCANAGGAPDDNNITAHKAVATYPRADVAVRNLRENIFMGF